MASTEHRNQADKAKRQGALSKLIHLIISLPVILLMTILFSIIVELVGMYFELWDLPGSEHSLDMLKTEAIYINSYFTSSVMGSSPVAWASSVVAWLDVNFFKPIGVADLKLLPAEDRTGIWDYIIASYYITKVALLRFCILTFSLPAYLLFGIVGIGTGLTERDLRRFGAGRESADRFELSQRFIKPSIGLCFVLYLSWPNSINPAFIVVPFAALFGWSLHLTTSNYKKYF